MYSIKQKIKSALLKGAKPKIVIVNGVDRVGKDTFINEIDRQTKYKHITIDRGPDGFQAYCEIFDKGVDAKNYYKRMEQNLALDPDVINIYIDCETQELVKRCIETNHEILDFDYHKKIMKAYFDLSPIRQKIVVDTTHEHASEIVKRLIDMEII